MAFNRTKGIFRFLSSADIFPIFAKVKVVDDSSPFFANDLVDKGSGYNLTNGF